MTGVRAVLPVRVPPSSGLVFLPSPARAVLPSDLCVERFICTPTANQLRSLRSTPNPPALTAALSCSIVNNMPPNPPLPEKAHFLALRPGELDALFSSWGWPRFRGDQVRDWVYKKLVNNFTEMSNLSAAERAILEQRLEITPSRIVSHQTSNDGTQ